MLMLAMQKIAQDDQGAPVSDVVLSVPAYFTDAERRAMLDASKIAGLNCLRLMNDTTAGQRELAAPGTTPVAAPRPTLGVRSIHLFPPFPVHLMLAGYVWCSGPGLWDLQDGHARGQDNARRFRGYGCHGHDGEHNILHQG